jgi:N-acetylglucosaminyl-diphospho-decaprenol L-rhamnosyltransferase
MTSDLAIITVTYQSSAKIADCISSARAAAPSAEIVVVDNASVDGTGGVVEAQDIDITLVRAPRNLGFGRGCNLGAEATQAAWLLFLNPDVLLQGVNIPKRLPGSSFGLGAGIIANGAEPGSPGVRANTTHMEDWFQEVWKLFVPKPLSRHLPVRRRPGAWPIGGMFLARRDEYQRIGGFDPRYFLFFEDRDLGRRYRSEQLPVHVVRGFTGTHWQGSSSSGVAPWQREAWSIVSWLEYIAVWRSQHHAAATAQRVLDVLATISRLADSRVLPERARLKAHSAELISTFIMDFDAFLPGEPDTYYMGARQAIRTTTRSSMA